MTHYTAPVTWVLWLLCCALFGVNASRCLDHNKTDTMRDLVLTIIAMALLGQQL